jgi:hypothetical protein
MLVLREVCGKSSGTTLKSTLDRGNEYAERTRRLAEGCTFCCRTVLILTALLIFLMPLTEHFYSWDKFLHGGRDVEFGTLCLLLFVGLVLLMAHRAMTSPLAVLLAHRVIALPQQCLKISGVPSFLFLPRKIPGTFLSISYLPGTPLRI